MGSCMTKITKRKPDGAPPPESQKRIKDKGEQKEEKKEVNEIVNNQKREVTQEKIGKRDADSSLINSTQKNNYH